MAAFSAAALTAGPRSHLTYFYFHYETVSLTGLWCDYLSRPCSLCHSQQSETVCLSASCGSCRSPEAAPGWLARAGAQERLLLEGEAARPQRYLHVFAQRAGVRVGLIAHLAKVGLVASVHVHVLLAVAAVGEAPVAALELALEGLLP